jgi:hypothetical protein
VWAGHEGAWLVLVGVIAAPITVVAAAAWMWQQTPGTSTARGTATHLVGAALVAPFRKSCSWFGAVWLADRLVFSVILVAAGDKSLLQTLLVSELFWSLRRVAFKSGSDSFNFNCSRA